MSSGQTGEMHLFVTIQWMSRLLVFDWKQNSLWEVLWDLAGVKRNENPAWLAMHSLEKCIDIILLDISGNQDWGTCNLIQRSTSWTKQIFSHIAMFQRSLSPTLHQPQNNRIIRKSVNLPPPKPEMLVLWGLFLSSAHELLISAMDYMCLPKIRMLKP